MQWLGKSIGGLIGAVIAGPFGSLVGMLVGHQWDQTSGAPRGAPASARGVSRLFFEVTFEVMGQIAKADGRVSEDEVRAARRVMQSMQLDAEQTRIAIDRFTHGKAADYALTERLAALARQIGTRAELARAFVQIQLQSALAVGTIGGDKRQLLWRVASALGVSRVELAQIESLMRGFEQGGQRALRTESIETAYGVLGVSADASDDEVKTAYRRLMNQHHPDKLAARGLPPSMIDEAEHKTHEVRAAYERIKTRRGFK